MAPRRRPVNVVRSGNAGNSSKAKKDDKADEPQDGPPRPPPLFPPGYKSPVTQLNEKCQKMGWERPQIDTRTNNKTDPPTFTGSVTLRKRVSKNVYDLAEVRFVPIPPLEIATAAEAKHWLATYALFRFCNHLPMSMGLPPSIRPYWSQLMAEKAAAPEHRAWEYAQDPFAAKKEVEARQTRRQEKQAAHEDDSAGAVSRGGSGAGTPGGRGGGLSSGGVQWDRAPEVKMANALREMVESTVKKMMEQYPSAVMEGTKDASGSGSTRRSGTAMPSLDVATLGKQLKTLGFRPAHADSCLAAVETANARLHGGSGSSSSSSNDPLVLSLSILPPLEAAIEWLLLHLPEDDLPQRYRPSTSSADFVTGASVSQGGKTALVKGWMVDKLVKQAGFPRKAVEAGLEQAQHESVALDILGRRLCGWEGTEEGWGVTDHPGPWTGDGAATEERDTARDEELMALEAVLGDRYSKVSATEHAALIEATTSSDKVHLHIVFDEASAYPSPQYPTHPPAFYLTSPTLPSYMRLHLHAQLLRQFRDPERHDLRGILESGMGGAVLSMVEYVETALDEVVAAPPDIAAVTRYLAPQPVETPKVAQTTRMQKSQITRTHAKRKAPSSDDHEHVRRHRAEVFERPEYAKMLDDRKKLPAWPEREKITSALDKNRVLVVVGETGCGKSTQLPQFILDHEIDQGRGASCNIFVTQPRRVAAIGVASRVAAERLEDIDRRPETVGYVIRGEKSTSRDTRITFCTTGIMLRRLGSGDAELEGVSHVIVDEAHERGVDTDLFICLLREILQRNKTIKVILMSATINEQIFINYFGGCPSLTIPGFTHPVEDHYLEDVIPLLDFRAQPPRFAPRINEDQKKAIRADIAKLDLDPKSTQSLEILEASQQIDYALIAAVVKHIVNTAASPKGAILVFLPGVQEIRMCVSELETAALGMVEIMPLHANLSSAEQKRVFLSTGSKRKIVVATNVAETSVTIPDVIYVVDGGRVKETQFDADNGLQRLVEDWTSRASGRQRRGRAGRTQPGQCFKLYTRRTEQNRMPRFPVPEILRTPLEALFLQVKAMDEDIDVKAFLGQAIDPPKMEAMDKAWETLLDLGIVEGEDQKSRLTALGRHVAMIPVDVRLAKMLVLGALFKCLDPIITIAAILSSKPLFTSPMDKRDQSKKARESFARGKSDLLTDVNAYDAVMAMRGKGGQSAIRQFCEDNFISASTIRDLSSLRQDFISALTQIGFIDNSGPNGGIKSYSINANNDALLKAVVVGGLYPRIARIATPTAMFTQVQAGAVQKDHEAKELKLFDQSGRVFIHPSSVLFSEAGFKSGFVAYFGKAETSKVFLRDATEVPLYSLLLFGGPMTVNHWAGGIMLGKDGWIKLRANTRIGVLCSQLRRLLDAQLAERIEAPHAMDLEGHDEVIAAMLALLARDGLTQ